MNPRDLLFFLKRRQRAIAVGYPLKPTQLGTTRDLTAAVPRHFVLHGKRIAILLPQQTASAQVFQEVIIEDVYELLSVRRDVKTVLDIGGNVGLFSLLAREVFPKATIHAYEPNPQLESYLKHQAGIGRFTYFLEAVQRDTGFVDLALTDCPLETTSTRTIDGAIPATALQTTIERLGGSVDYVKMDCEGAEWEMLEDPLPWQSMRYLALEYHAGNGRTADDALRRLDQLGFKIEKHKINPTVPGIGVVFARRSPDRT